MEGFCFYAEVDAYRTDCVGQTKLSISIPVVIIENVHLNDLKACFQFFNQILVFLL